MSFLVNLALYYVSTMSLLALYYISTMSILVNLALYYISTMSILVNLALYSRPLCKSTLRSALIYNWLIKHCSSVCV